MSYDPDNPTQAEIDAIAAALQRAYDDPTARASAIIMTKIVLRALREANGPKAPEQGARPELSKISAALMEWSDGRTLFMGSVNCYEAAKAILAARDRKAPAAGPQP